MTTTCPNPLANPLNSRRFSNMGIQYGAAQPWLRTSSDPSKLKVPDPTINFEIPNQDSTFGSMFGQQTNKLTVPNQDVPDYSSQNYIGFIGNSSLFKLYDGTILDLEKHVVVKKPSQKAPTGHWSGSGRVIDANSLYNTPGLQRHPDDFQSVMTAIESGDMQAAVNVDSRIDPYWKMVKEQSRKLVQNLTDKQKELLRQLDTEQFFPMSKLEEE